LTNIHQFIIPIDLVNQGTFNRIIVLVYIYGTITLIQSFFYLWVVKPPLHKIFEPTSTRFEVRIVCKTFCFLLNITMFHFLTVSLLFDPLRKFMFHYRVNSLFAILFALNTLFTPSNNVLLRNL